MSIRYDTVIIGAGPAGLAAAVTLKIRNKNILVLGSEDVSHKVEKAHEVGNYLGLPAIDGKKLAELFLEHARSMEVPIRRGGITAVYDMGGYYGLLTRENEILEAKTVILATGVHFGKPYPGEERFLGRGVSYCATCDAPLYKGRKVAVIASSAKEEAEAAFLAELASEVVYIPLYSGEISLPETVKILRDVPVEITGEQTADTLLLKENRMETDGIFILRESISPAQLVPGLQMEENFVAVNRRMETNLPGLYACGDLTGTPFQIQKAAGEGNIAALSAVEYLSSRK